MPVAVAGGGLGGLSAAIYLRAAGYSVRVYEANGRVGGRANRIETDGFRFDTGPSLLNYPWVFEELFHAAGARLEDYVELLPVEPGVAFQWPDGTRFALSSDLAALAASLEPVERDVAPGLMRFLSDAGAKYDLAFAKLVGRNVDNPLVWFASLRLRELKRLSVWRSLYGELGRFFRSRHIREAFGSYGMYLGGSPFELPGVFSILPYGELAYGLWLPRGGIYGLVEGVERLARDLGVEILTGARIERIETGGGAVKGVRRAGGGVDAFPLVVSNVDVPVTDAQLLGHERLLDRRRRKNARMRMTPGVVTFYWGVRGSVRGLGHHTIFLPEAYRDAFRDLIRGTGVPRGLPFYVSVASATDPTLAPAGATTVFVLVPVPLLHRMGDVDWEQVTAEIKARVLERLERHGCDLTADRIAVEHVYTPRDWRDRFGLHEGSGFGAAHTLFQVGPFRARNYARELRGMYYTGASTTPGTGMPMVILSGKLTAERIVAREG